ncbi:heterokaryon incompatibility protein-domain-containing protein [Xylariales sp. PMI_506]|nr:heterokaryon incompatibility protein-domain-containing protein [Xylariales sp. PMI_506]
MRLLDTHTKTLVSETFYEPDLPKYAILSHTWESDEVSFQDMDAPDKARKKRGWSKISRACDQARQAGFDYAWVDTCCINKESSAELSEAINSMYFWYQNAAECYVYLSDYDPPQRSSSWPDEVALGRCRWFARGWTLQELLAPERVYFFDSRWDRISRHHDKAGLAELLSRITGVPRSALLGRVPPSRYSIAQRMSWAARRETTRIEDQAYCLLGIFDVNMPLLYGERHKAFFRLQEEILRQNLDLTILAWSPPAAGTSAKEAEAEAEFCSALASSPSAFADCGDIEAFAGEDCACLSTPKGLQLNISVKKYRGRGRSPSPSESASFLLPSLRSPSLSSPSPPHQRRRSPPYSSSSSGGRRRTDYYITVGESNRDGGWGEVSIGLRMVGPSVWARDPGEPACVRGRRASKDHITKVYDDFTSYLITKPYQARTPAPGSVYVEILQHSWLRVRQARPDTLWDDNEGLFHASSVIGLYIMRLSVELPGSGGGPGSGSGSGSGSWSSPSRRTSPMEVMALIQMDPSDSKPPEILLFDSAKYPDEANQLISTSRQQETEFTHRLIAAKYPRLKKLEGVLRISHDTTIESSSHKCKLKEDQRIPAWKIQLSLTQGMSRGGKGGLSLGRLV